MKSYKICIVCCQHGDEVFGEEVYKYFSNNKNQYPNVDLIIANKQALKLGRRFLDTDLNRSFSQPNNLTGHEARLAPTILRRARKADFVIDIHTTTSDVEYFPIVSKFNKKIKIILSNIPSDKVVQMNKQIAGVSLIGNVDAGISMEFNENYAKRPVALKIVREVVQNISQNSLAKFNKKNLYVVSGTIENDVSLGVNAKNFEYENIHKIYPILIGEKNYVKHQGFYAKTKTIISV